MSTIILQVDEARRTLSAMNSGGVFVVRDKNVNTVRFALLTGFADIVLDEHSALRVMYQRPGETEVRAKTLTYHDTDGIYGYYDWELLAADLESKGTLVVALCVLRADTEVEEWHTTPYQIKVLDSIHTDDSDDGDASITPSVAQRVVILESLTQRLYSMAGGAPAVVSSASDMVDPDQIYVLTTDGKWYYYDGSGWVEGGEYGTIPTDKTLSEDGTAADAKSTGAAIRDVNSSLDLLTSAVSVLDTEVHKDGDNSASYNRHFFTECAITAGCVYMVDVKFSECRFRTREDNKVFQLATARTASYNYLIDYIADVRDSFDPSTAKYIFKATKNAAWLYMFCYTSLNSALTAHISIKQISSLSEVEDIYSELGRNIFGSAVTLEFDPDYSYSATARTIGSYELEPGTYALTYNQDFGARPNNLNTRCTPWYTSTATGNVFMHTNPANVCFEPTERTWVFNISEQDTYTFYFWLRGTTPTEEAENVYITNLQLFKVDNVSGRLYNVLNGLKTKTDLPLAYLSQFQRVGCIGDSWTAGSIYQSENSWAGTLGNLSWAKNAERLTGSHFVQYAKGGLSSQTWLSDIHGKIALEHDAPCGLYFVFLGINDATELTDEDITLGEVDDFETETSGTFFYYYGAVVNAIQTHSPASKIILSTIMTRSAQQVVVRNAILDYAAAYSLPCIDVYEDEFFRHAQLVGGHPTARAHSGIAQALMRLTAKCIYENAEYFKINTMNKYGDYSIESLGDLIGKNLFAAPARYHREAETSHDATAYGIATVKLGAGQYIFKWSQTAATKINSDSRCTPVMVVGDRKTYFSGSSSFPNTTAGEYRWVLTIEEDCSASFYFWSKYLSEAIDAWGFDLYEYDSIRGRLDQVQELV